MLKVLLLSLIYIFGSVIYFSISLHMRYKADKNKMEQDDFERKYFLEAK